MSRELVTAGLWRRLCHIGPSPLAVSLSSFVSCGSSSANSALLFLSILIAHEKTFSPLDLVFWALVVALILVRYIDITRLHGLTKDGEPASLRDWHRYVLLLLLVSGALWGLAHAVLSRFMVPLRGYAEQDPAPRGTTLTCPLAIGIGMIPRGEVGLIFANIGLAISVNGERTTTFSAVVVMFLTTMVTPPALKWSLARSSRRKVCK